MEEKTRFSILFRPTLVYAILFTFCLYDNAKGILVAVLGLITVLYCNLIDRRQMHERKRDRLLYEIAFVLLALSCGLTDNDGIVFFNLVGMLFVLVVMLLHDHQDDDSWSIMKYLTEMVRTGVNAINGLSHFPNDIREENEQAESGRKKVTGYILIGLLIAMPMLAIILALLHSADIVFASVLNDMFESFDVTTSVLITLMMVFAFFFTYAGMRYFIRQSPVQPEGERKRYEPIIAITALTVISVVYLLFSGIQIAYLFIGNMTLPDGYTYAEYAREGFFQLLAVCALNLMIVLFVLAWFREHIVLKVLLSVISGCTYIMIASSAMRMVMYIREYNLTRKRILVLWALLVIGVLLAGVIVQIFKKDFRLFRYSLAVCVVCYLVLSFGRMDYWIARYDVDHCVTEHKDRGIQWFESTAEPDVPLDYLAELSCDAAPIIADYKGSWANDYRESIYDVQYDTLRQWNLSRYMARQALKKNGK